MADVISVGQGSSLTFSGFTAAIRSIGATSMSREMVDASDLSLSSYQRKVPAGLVDAGSFSCEFIFNASTTAPTICVPPVTGTTAVDTTIAFPAGANGTNFIELNGNSFVSAWDTPELTSDGLMVGNVTFTWEGENGTNSPTIAVNTA